jgi:hypothetical protein
LVPFLIYLVIICGLIYYNGLWNIFRDDVVTRKQFTIFFLLKALAIPAFYIVYTHVYGGLEKFDTGKFYNDASVINNYGRTNPEFFLRLLVGLQDDSEGSADYINCLVHTQNWDNGAVKDFLYNDNRVVIRVHAVLHFIAFNSYFAHALFSCLFSFIGIACLYLAFKDRFKGKEVLMLAIMCFLPALWFYTGALLKEGLTMFVLGCSALHVKKFADRRTLSGLAAIAILLFISVFLKPYILLFGTLCITAYFTLEKTNVRYKTVIFISAIIVAFLMANVLSLVARGRTLPDAVIAHQQRFADAARGGIFLLDDEKFVRLSYDTTQVEPVDGKPEHFTIRKNIPYTYWLLNALHDTLQQAGNTDTLTEYKLVYRIAESKSNIDPAIYSKGILSALATGFYYSLLHPLFYNAGTALRILASVENLLIIVSFVIFFIGMAWRRKGILLPFMFVFFALCVCLLTGLATPNSGAIFRYRAPAVIFILMAALYFLPLRNHTPGKTD